MSDPNPPQNQPQQPYQPQGNPYPPQQGYGQPYGQSAPVAQDPGKTLGIVGLVLSLVTGGLIGLIVSIIAYRKSKKAGFKNTPALIGIILGIVVFLLLIGIAVAIGVAGAAAYQQLMEACAAAGPGEQVTVGGTRVTCP